MLSDEFAKEIIFIKLGGNAAQLFTILTVDCVLLGQFRLKLHQNKDDCKHHVDVQRWFYTFPTTFYPKLLNNTEKYWVTPKRGLLRLLSPCQLLDFRLLSLFFKLLCDLRKVITWFGLVWFEFSSVSLCIDAICFLYVSFLLNFLSHSSHLILVEV